MANGACVVCGCSQGECECNGQAASRPLPPKPPSSGVTPRVTCYVTAAMNDDGQISRVTCFSEPPWNLTRRIGSNYAVLFEVTAGTFVTAAELAIAGYRQFMPGLAKKFPVQV